MVSIAMNFLAAAKLFKLSAILAIFLFHLQCSVSVKSAHFLLLMSRVFSSGSLLKFHQ